eukprot:s2032_g7.t1
MMLQQLCFHPLRPFPDRSYLRGSLRGDNMRQQRKRSCWIPCINFEAKQPIFFCAVLRSVVAPNQAIAATSQVDSGYLAMLNSWLSLQRRRRCEVREHSTYLMRWVFTLWWPRSSKTLRRHRFHEIHDEKDMIPGSLCTSLGSIRLG